MWIFPDIPSVYLKNVCLECVIDIQILYFEVMFSWQLVIFGYDFWNLLLMLFFFDMCFSKWSHHLSILRVVLSILIFGFKTFLWCFSSPQIKVINIQIFGFKMFLDIPLIRMCFPLGHMTCVYQWYFLISGALILMCFFNIP